ncbi:MAG: multicomponent Na+:H+ antiporter subunit [Actinomycetota bacterium]|nr:multicomponent Na+:H+ antiporter subunit [Actinomycetota bacterium]
MFRRAVALFAWAYTVWVLLTWTRTFEQLATGVVAATLTAAVCAPLGPVAPPWALLRPARLAGAARLVGFAAVRIVKANLSLSRRIWSPSLPLRPGMVVVPTELRSDGGVTAVALISSLIVDNQIVDLDRSRAELQYHAVWIDSTEPDANRAVINGPLEARLRPFAD